MRKLGALATIMAITFLLLEIFGRIADPFGISYYAETASYLNTMIIEDPIGYRNRPNLKGHFWGVPVSTNSLALRDQEIDLKPADNEFRILMLGDSILFGVGVADQDTITSQLEQQLNHGSMSRTYEVINMGVPSYNTEQELIQFQSLGIGLDPDLVLLMFSHNDVQPKMWVFERRESMLVNIAQRSYALSLLALFYWELRLALTGRESRAPYRALGEEHPGWSIVESALARISDLCKEMGTPFVVFAQGDYPRLKTIAKRIEVPLINLEAQTNDPRWNRPGSELLVSRVNPHPNPAGSHRYATMIRESLERLGMIPERRTEARVRGAEDAAAARQRLLLQKMKLRCAAC